MIPSTRADMAELARRVLRTHADRDDQVAVAETVLDLLEVVRILERQIDQLHDQIDVSSST